MSFFNGFMYVGVVNDSKILIVQNGEIINYINVNECSSEMSTYFDLYGNMAVSCSSSNLVSLYDNNNNYTNNTITTSQYPYTTAVDFSGRLIIITRWFLDIYY